MFGNMVGVEELEGEEVKDEREELKGGGSGRGEAAGKKRWGDEGEEER